LPGFFFEEWLQSDGFLSFSHYLLLPSFIAFSINLDVEHVIFVRLMRLQRGLNVCRDQAKGKIETNTKDSANKSPHWVDSSITDFPCFFLNLLAVFERNF
jgi:hypothetical protein